MHIIEPHMTPLKNDVIIENDFVFDQNYFCQWRHLWWRQQQKTKTLKICGNLPNYKIWALCHFCFWSSMGGGNANLLSCPHL